MTLELILTSILISFAAIFKALADTVADHFDTSVFRHYKKSFWDKKISSDFAKRVFAYKIDAWHLANSGMIICFICTIDFKPNVHWLIIIIGGGIVFNLVFNLFYNKIFRQ